jgi:DUF971 family protein
MSAPDEIRLASDKRTLTVVFPTRSHALPAEYLRVMSPSAEVQGHSAAERKVLGGKREVCIIGVEPVGNYAIRLVFDDMHSTGIFSWEFLDQLGLEHDARWAKYLEELAERGLTREPRIVRRG